MIGKNAKEVPFGVREIVHSLNGEHAIANRAQVGVHLDGWEVVSDETTSRCAVGEPFALPFVDLGGMPADRLRADSDRGRKCRNAHHFVNCGLLETYAARNFVEIEELDRGGIRHGKNPPLGDRQNLISFS